MRLKDTFKIALRGLRAHESRSILTILGIVIGITAITLVVSVGQGARELILGQIEAFGPTLVEINPGREPQGPSDFGEFFSDSLKRRDLEAIQDPGNVRGVEWATPIVLQNATLSYGGETFRASVIGANSYFGEMFDMYPEIGSNFTDADVASRASVTVIGSKVKEELFGPSDVLGEKIRIGNRLFRVVGVFAERGQMSFFNPDEMVVVPYTTAQDYLLGTDYFHSLDVKISSEELVPQAVEDIKITLRELHGITDPEKDDFYVGTQADAAARIGAIMSILTALLVSVAAVSLLVGGVGIMNIMLVSVAERTHEIGLRKAVGATNKDILTQFLLEAVILTVTGGVIGIVTGAALSLATAFVLSRIVSIGWGFVFSFPAALIGLTVSAAVGLIFGIHPAREASRKSPIEALRYE